jgi:O-antigen/teichoic acid export membrane protein
MGTSLLNVAVVALGGGITGLLYSTALAPLLTSLAALLLYRATRPAMDGFPELLDIVRAAPSVPIRRYFSFSALVSLDKNFANLLALAPELLLGRLAAAEQLAFFRIGFNLMNFLSIPLAPIARNLYAKLAEITARGRPGDLGRALLKVTLVAGGVSVASSAVMMVLAPYILMIYRPVYMPALPVMYALGVRFALLGFGVGLGAIYQVLGEMKLALATKIVPGLVMFAGGWVLVSSYGAVGAAATLVIAYLIGDVTNAFLVPYIVRRAARRAVLSSEF